MRPLLDVNVLIIANRSEQPRHAEVRDYVDGLRNGSGIFGVPELAMSGFLRIITSPKPFAPPSSTSQALKFCRSFIDAPSCVVVRPSKTHWQVFESLCQTLNVRGKLVPDAYFAAMAIDQGFEFVTTDGDFAKFPGLTWRRPWDRQSATNPR